jgi:hypothetical protein
MKRIATLMTLSLLVGVISLSFTACFNEEGTPPLAATESAPELPSPSTMLMDLSFFGIDGLPSEDQKSANSQAMLAAAGERSSWIQAVVRAVFVLLTFYDTIEEPFAAFAVAIHAVPQPQPDGSYLWTYIFVDGDIEYSIFLFGKVVDDHVEWRMEVSSNNPEMPLDHFVWFDGESMRDDSYGYWQFYRPTDTAAVLASSGGSAMTEGVPVIRIDWENGGPRSGRLVVTNNEVGGEGEGDVLEFRETPSKNTIDFTDADTEQHHNITWYRDGSGSITVPHWNSGDKACWDTKQRNVDCP